MVLRSVAARSRVLVTDDVDGRNRSAVAAVRALAQAGYAPVVTVSGPSSLAAASRHSRGRVLVPRPGQPGYRDAVEGELFSGRYLAVLPASDASLVALGHPGGELVDKSVLTRRSSGTGFPVPPTWTFPSVQALRGAADGMPFPLVVKAAVKSTGQPPARRVDTAAQLALVNDLAGEVVVQPFESGTMRAVSGVVWEGELLALAHQRYERIWPTDCGVASAAVTTGPDLDLEERLLPLLDGHRGVFQAQLVGENLLDVNPRVYGSLPLAVAAGTNLPAVACAAAQGRREPLVRARPGVHYRWLEGDLRHLLRRARARELPVSAALEALRPRRGTAHSVESLSDPGPLLTRVTHALGSSRP